MKSSNNQIDAEKQEQSSVLTRLIAAALGIVVIVIVITVGIAILPGAVEFSAHAAQVDPYAPDIASVTNLPAIVNTATTSNTTSYIKVRRGAGLSLNWKFNVSAGTSNGVVLLVPSNDGTNYTAPPWQWLGTATSTTDTGAFTNWSAAQLSGIDSFKVTGMTNQNSGTLTNKGIIYHRPVP
jgi:hypothetical protein